MNKRYYILCLIIKISFISTIQAQTASFLIKGKVIDEEKKGLPFATIYNQSNFRGTITNESGYFELEIQSSEDSIFITYVGYQRKRLDLLSNQSVYEIQMNPSTFLLKEVTIISQNDDYLFELLKACKENQSQEYSKAKAYYQLKSYQGETQLELVENFYNAVIKGYDLKKLQLKTGRLGLQAKDERLFTSLESSKAIGMQQLFDASTGFPINPLELKRRKLKKAYYLDVEKQYLDDNSDTIIILTLKPKINKRLYFTSKLWIDKKDKQIIKAILSGTDLMTHPFLPLFQDDKIDEMNIQIVKSFIENDGKMLLEHVDFNYSFKYISRRYDSYYVRTKAVLQLYDHQNTFELPHFKFDRNLSDYRKLNAFPYNDFFWRFNDELSLNDAIDSNRIFMEDPYTISNKKIFSNNDQMKNRLFEAPFIHWKGNRLLFKNLIPKTETANLSEYPDFEVLLFVDYSQYQDSSHILSSVIFNPYESHFNGEYTAQTNCFLNMYFDLMEIERREFLNRLSLNESSDFEKMIEDCEKKMIEQKELFFRETNYGQNLEQMIVWNDLIVSKLNIDNIEQFKLQEIEEAASDTN